MTAPVAKAPRTARRFTVRVHKTFTCDITVAAWESDEAVIKAETMADLGECHWRDGAEAHAVHVVEEGEK